MSSTPRSGGVFRFGHRTSSGVEVEHRSPLWTLHTVGSCGPRVQRTREALKAVGLEE